MNIKIFKGLNDDIKNIRIKVFVDEQGFTEEFDALDDICTFSVLYENDLAVGTARLIPSENDFHIGRFAILKDYRKKGYGKLIMESLENEARNLNCKKISISSQEQAIPFYEKCGYKKVNGNLYYDQHVLHMDLYKEL